MSIFPHCHAPLFQISTVNYINTLITLEPMDMKGERSQVERNLR